MILQALLRGYKRLLEKEIITIDQIPEPYKSELQRGD